MIYLTEYPSPVGKLTIASNGKSITGLWIEGQKYFADTLTETPVMKNDLQIFFKAKSWLNGYFSGEKPLPHMLSLEPSGSEFRKAVWKCLCEIPYGETVTYGTISKRIAEQFGKSTMSAQAVGGAVGHNPISIIIPCHRVIGAKGNLTGYAGGIDKKIQLLKHEGIDTENLFIPKNQT